MKLTRNLKIFIGFIIFLITFALVVGLLTRTISLNPPGISDLFACGDYCPGDASQYTVKVYQGVNTKVECDNRNGEFLSFTGWGTTYYCKVK